MRGVFAAAAVLLVLAPAFGASGGVPAAARPDAWTGGAGSAAHASVCPGAPPSAGGMHRRPDTARDLDGRLHMVWSERFEGQLEVCHAVQGRGMGLGLGSGRNPALRLTDTPWDSHDPRIAVDPATGLLYVLWTEDLPELHTEPFGEGLEPARFYVAMDPAERVPRWTDPFNLADGREPVKSFAVTEGLARICPTGRPRCLDVPLDTDRDGLGDAVEFLALNKVPTDWRLPDTDGDGLTDPLEIRGGFDPTVDERFGPRGQEFLLFSALWADPDGDGIPYADEVACGFPVTAGVAVVRDGGRLVYEFFPREDHQARLHVSLLLRATDPLPPPPRPASFRLDFTVETGAFVSSFSHRGSALEEEPVTAIAGLLSVGKDDLVRVTIDVVVEQPAFYSRDLVVRGVMLAAIPPDEGLFDYTEGRGFDWRGSRDAGGAEETYTTCGDPARPDVFLEVDALFNLAPPLPGFAFDVYTLAKRAFSDAGILLHYKLDEERIRLDERTDPDPDGDGVATLRDGDELRDFLHRHKNPALPGYMHVVFVDRISPVGRSTIAGIAISAGTAEDRTHAGHAIASGALHGLGGSAATFEERVLKVLIHEIGHGLGASHEKRGGAYDPRVDGPGGEDVENEYNAMTSWHLTDPWEADLNLRGVGNTNRDLGATERLGRPRFSIESVGQFDLRAKLSVDTGRNVDILDRYV